VLLYGIGMIIWAIVDTVKLINRFIAYNRVKRERAHIRNFGIAHKGFVVDTEMEVKEEYIRIWGKTYWVTRHYYYATIEFGDFGKKVTFQTPKLSDNAKFLNTKEVKVYTLNGSYYATDFGNVVRPKKRIKDLFWWMEDDNGQYEKR